MITAYAQQLEWHMNHEEYQQQKLRYRLIYHCKLKNEEIRAGIWSLPHINHVYPNR